MKFGSVEIEELGEIKIGDLVKWNEKEATGTGLDYIKGKITDEGDHLSIFIHAGEDGTDLGKPALAYLLSKSRLDNIKKYRGKNG